MKVSVILPVFNGAATLSAAIESVLTQEMGDFELIAIDDASTDQTPDILQGFALRDPRVRIVSHRQNCGLPHALNEGLRLARANLAARMDHDDECMPGRLGMQYLFFQGRPRLAACGSFIYNMGVSRQRDRLVRMPVSPAEIARKLPLQNCLCHPAVMMRRDLALEAGGYHADFRNSEDYDLWLRLSRRHDLANVPVALLRYRFSVSGQSLGRKWEQLFFSILAREAYQHPERSFAENVAGARRHHEAQDRMAFMEAVALGTVEELLALGWTEDAQALVARFSDEIRPEVAERLRSEAAARGIQERSETPVLQAGFTGGKPQTAPPAGAIQSA